MTQQSATSALTLAELSTCGMRPCDKDQRGSAGLDFPSIREPFCVENDPWNSMPGCGHISRVVTFDTTFQILARPNVTSTRLQTSQNVTVEHVKLVGVSRRGDRPRGLGSNRGDR